MTNRPPDFSSQEDRSRVKLPEEKGGSLEIRKENRGRRGFVVHLDFNLDPKEPAEVVPFPEKGDHSEGSPDGHS